MLHKTKQAKPYLFNISGYMYSNFRKKQKIHEYLLLLENR